MGGAVYKDKKCLDCGVLMPHVSARRLRCPQCAKTARAKMNRENMRSKRSVTQIEKYSAVAKVCDGCAYYFGSYDFDRCCNYIFIRGHKRPCPAGEECTVRVERLG